MNTSYMLTGDGRKIVSRTYFTDREKEILVSKNGLHQGTWNPNGFWVETNSLPIEEAVRITKIKEDHWRASIKRMSII